jgi:preprotein translocase subunit Sec63
MVRYIIVAVALFLLIRVMSRIMKGKTALHRTRSDRSPYETLGVKEGACREDVEKAWKQLCRDNHPDKVAHLDPKIQDMVNRRFQSINEAYQELTDDPWT